MTDVDQILRAHAADAVRAEPAADGWDRLVTRLDDPSAGGPGGPGGPGGAGEPGGAGGDDGRHHHGRADRTGRGALVVAAATIAVVLVAGGVALARAGDDTGDTDGLERPATAPTTAPATPSTTESGTGRPAVDHASQPDRIVAVRDHDGDGRPDLVRLEGLGVEEDVPGLGGTTASGLRPAEVTVLVAGADVAPEVITSVDVAADGTAFYAVGEEVWTVDGRGVVSGPMADGTLPAVSEDGETLATLVGVDVHLLDVPSGESRVVAHDEVLTEEVTGLSLSPDGQRIARQRVTRAADGTVASSAVDVMDTDASDAWVEVERSSGLGLPAFMADGHLAVGLGAWGASEGHAEVRADSVGMADLATGEVRASVGGGGFSFNAIDASPDGRWVLVVFQDGVRAFAAVDGWLWDSGTVVGGEGMVDAAW